MKNQFEQHIKQSLESFEAEYNPADWADMQNKLSKAKAGKSTGIGKKLMIAASVAVVGGVIYYFAIRNTESKITLVDSTNIQQVIVADKKPIQVADNNTAQTPNLTQKHNSVNNSDNKKTVSKDNSKENNPTISEKKGQPVTNNAVENKIVIQDQPKESVIADPQPIQPSVIPFGASFHSNVNKVCEGSAVQFVADNKDVSCTYKWNFGDGSSSSEQNPSHIFSEAGTYNVKLRVVSAKDKKQADQKNTIIVVAAPSVQVNYSAAEDNSLLINFEADADKIIEWKWNFGDKQTSSVQNPSHTYNKKGNYKAELTAKNALGCSTIVVKEVNLKNNINLLAPNAFSPDGNGVNDTWMPVALLNGDYAFTLTISDKAGNVVFKTSDKNHPWEGQNAKRGDTFRWIAIVKDKSGDETICQGLITISE